MTPLSTGSEPSTTLGYRLVRELGSSASGRAEVEAELAAEVREPELAGDHL